MEFHYQEDRIELWDDEKKVIALVSFPAVDKDTVNIERTYVDNSLRGQGVGGKLMEAAARHLQEQGKKAVLGCSYALGWFQKHPEYVGLVAEEGGEQS